MMTVLERIIETYNKKNNVKLMFKSYIAVGKYKGQRMEYQPFDSAATSIPVQAPYNYHVVTELVLDEIVLLRESITEMDVHTAFSKKYLDENILSQKILMKIFINGIEKLMTDANKSDKCSD